MVTDKQVQLLRLKMAQGKTVEAAAAAAGMSARSAHTWKEGALPSQTKRQRHWRTRVDVFADVWESEVVPLLERDEAGVLEATTIIAELGRAHGQRFTDKHHRSPREPDEQVSSSLSRETRLPKRRIDQRPGRAAFGAAGLRIAP